MRCCGYDEFFDARIARKDADRYRRKGLRASARQVLEQARRRRARRCGGAGDRRRRRLALVELVRAGAGARDGGRALVRLRAGGGSRCSPSKGSRGASSTALADVVEDGDEVGSADVVVLERVVCCYPDATALVGAAAERARRRLVLSYPRYGCAHRAFGPSRTSSCDCAAASSASHAHPPETIRAAALAARAAAGRPGERRPVWRVAAFDRAYLRAVSEIGLFPLGIVLLPTELVPLHIFEERYRELIGECLARSASSGSCSPTTTASATVGTRAAVTEVLERFDDGRLNIVVEGRERFRVVELTDGRSFQTAEVEPASTTRTTAATRPTSSARSRCSRRSSS